MEVLARWKVLPPNCPVKLGSAQISGASVVFALVRKGYVHVFGGSQPRIKAVRLAQDALCMYSTYSHAGMRLYVGGSDGRLYGHNIRSTERSTAFVAAEELLVDFKTPEVWEAVQQLVVVEKRVFITSTNRLWCGSLEADSKPERLRVYYSTPLGAECGSCTCTLVLCCEPSMNIAQPCCSALLWEGLFAVSPIQSFRAVLVLGTEHGGLKWIPVIEGNYTQSNLVSNLHKLSDAILCIGWHKWPTVTPQSVSADTLHIVTEAGEVQFFGVCTSPTSQTWRLSGDGHLASAAFVGNTVAYIREAKLWIQIFDRDIMGQTKPSIVQCSNVYGSVALTTLHTVPPRIISATSAGRVLIADVAGIDSRDQDRILANDLEHLVKTITRGAQLEQEIQQSQTRIGAELAAWTAFHSHTSDCATYEDVCFQIRKAVKCSIDLQHTGEQPSLLLSPARQRLCLHSMRVNFQVLTPDLIPFLRQCTIIFETQTGLARPSASSSTEHFCVSVNDASWHSASLFSFQYPFESHELCFIFATCYLHISFLSHDLPFIPKPGSNLKECPVAGILVPLSTRCILQEHLCCIGKPDSNTSLVVPSTLLTREHSALIPRTASLSSTPSGTTQMLVVVPNCSPATYDNEANLFCTSRDGTAPPVSKWHWIRNALQKVTGATSMPPDSLDVSAIEVRSVVHGSCVLRCFTGGNVDSIHDITQLHWCVVLETSSPSMVPIIHAALCRAAIAELERWDYDEKEVGGRYPLRPADRYCLPPLLQQVCSTVHSRIRLN
jgi:hypothetical protein